MGILFPARESLVSEIPAGDGNPLNLFLQCSAVTTNDTKLSLSLQNQLKKGGRLRVTFHIRVV